MLPLVTWDLPAQSQVDFCRAAILQEVLSVHSIEKANFSKVRLFIEILPELLKLTEFRVLRKGVKVRVSLFRQVLELKLPKLSEKLLFVGEKLYEL